MERIKKLTRMIRIYVSYFKIKFLNEIQYKVAAIAGSCTQFVWAGMYIMLYTAFLKDGSASDFSARQMTTYIWLQQAFFAFFNIWNIDKEIEEQCRLGDIATELVKPISLYSIWHAKSLAKKNSNGISKSPTNINSCYDAVFRTISNNGTKECVILSFKHNSNDFIRTSNDIFYNDNVWSNTKNGNIKWNKNYVWISDGLCVRRTYSNTIYARIYNKHLKIHTILLHAKCNIQHIQWLYQLGRRNNKNTDITSMLDYIAYIHW